MHYHLTRVSTNRKTGPIPVATSSRETCPSSCPLIGEGGCYAEGGPLRIHWDRITTQKAGVSFQEFLKQLRRLPRRQLWRYGQAGDLPGEGDEIDEGQMKALVDANQGRPVIAFTHKPPTEKNLDVLRRARDGGFRVNLSADNLEEADDFMDLGMPTVVVLPHTYGRNSKGAEWSETLSEYRSRIRKFPDVTPKGRRIAVCPATYTDTTCSECGICAYHSRPDVVVGFPAHGHRKHLVA